MLYEIPGVHFVNLIVHYDSLDDEQICSLNAFVTFSIVDGEVYVLANGSPGGL